MNSAENKKKKISEYTFDDIKKFFSDNIKKISSSIILLEIGNDFLNIGLAKSKNNSLYVKKVFRQILLASVRGKPPKVGRVYKEGNALARDSISIVKVPVENNADKT